MSKAANLLNDICSFWMPDIYRGRRCSIGPGQYVERMSPERRAVLAQLKSGDIANTRLDAVWPGEESEHDRQKRLFSEEKLEFDRKMLGMNVH